MEYRIDDKMLNASVFLPFVNQVWPGDYDIEKTKNALAKTLNITAYDGKKTCRLPAYSFRRIFLRNDYRATYTSRVSEARDWKPTSPTCQGEHPYHAVFWFTAGN